MALYQNLQSFNAEIKSITPVISPSEGWQLCKYIRAFFHLILLFAQSFENHQRLKIFAP
jgi:hypothetical protein